MPFKSGQIPWNKGLTKETDLRVKNLSEALTGENHPMYGKHHSEETRRKISEALTGRKLSEETKRKMSLSRQNIFGENAPMFGKHHTTETIEKMRLSKIGSKNPMWKGNKASKYSAMERARRKYSPPEDCEIHHIDGNPFNNSPSNIKFVTRKQHMIEDGRMEALIKRNKQGRTFYPEEGEE